MTRAAARGRRGESGESLIELLMALVIMGIAVVTIVGAIGTSIVMSDIHRKQATAGSYVRSWAAAIQSYAGSDGNYDATCGSLPPLNTVPGLSTVGYTGSATCAAAGNLTTITVTVASTDGRDSEQLQLVVRRPCVAQTTAPAGGGPATIPGCT